jgi:perosamine synthetase
MIHLAIPDLSGNEAKYLQECIETTFVSSVGPFVTRLEEMMQDAVGAAYAVASSSGTTGLHLALTTLGVQPDDLVILPSFTFIASANAISHCGASPWLVDVAQESWTLDPQLLQEALAKDTKKTDNGLIHIPTGKRVAAIMPVYTFGMPADMEAIRIIADQYELPVAADAAAAVGAEYAGKMIGGLADISVFSFNGNKTITAGGGGMLVGNNRELLDRARHLSTTARCGSDYDHDMVGFNYRMTNIQAAVGCAQMERLEDFVAAKRSIDMTYRQQLENIQGISFFPAPAWADSACWFTGIVVESNELPPVPDICKQLQKRGIGARTFWKPVHFQKPYASCPRTEMVVSEQIWNKILTLPCSTHLSEHEQETVITELESILK